MGDLVTLAGAKEYLQLTGTDDDNFITTLIHAASKLAQDYCQRDFILTTYTEYLNGNGLSEICLKHYPIVSITSLYDDTAREFDAETLIDAEDYIYDEDSGMIMLDGLTFSKGLKNIKVVYEAGYEEIPYNLQQAIKEIIFKKYRAGKNKKQGIKTDGIVDKSTTFESEDIPKEAKFVLDLYKRETY